MFIEVQKWIGFRHHSAGVYAKRTMLVQRKPNSQKSLAGAAKHCEKQHLLSAKYQASTINAKDSLGKRYNPSHNLDVSK